MFSKNSRVMLRWQAVDNFDLLGLSEAESRIEHAISWNDVDQQVDECGDDDEEHYESMLSATVEAVTSWKNQLTQWVP